MGESEVFLHGWSRVFLDGWEWLASSWVKCCVISWVDGWDCGASISGRGMLQSF